MSAVCREVRREEGKKGRREDGSVGWRGCGQVRELEDGLELRGPYDDALVCRAGSEARSVGRDGDAGDVLAVSLEEVQNAPVDRSHHDDARTARRQDVLPVAAHRHRVHTAEDADAPRTYRHTRAYTSYAYTCMWTLRHAHGHDTPLFLSAQCAHTGKRCTFCLAQINARKWIRNRMWLEKILIKKSRKGRSHGNREKYRESFGIINVCKCLL